MDRLNCPFEVKIAAGSDDGCFSGYGSVFGNLDSHRDVVAKGAFSKTLLESKSGAASWPAMLLMHGIGDNIESKMPIGIWTAIDEDDVGLKVEGKFALATQRGAEAYALCKMTPRPALSGLSIGYRASDFVMGTKTDKARRTLKAVDLVEVSLVVSPSNVKATITGIKSELNTIREFENFLRDAGGFSISQAKAIAATGYKAIADLRDEDGEADHQDSAQLKKLADFISSITTKKT